MTDLDALANEYIDKHLYGGNKRTHLVALLEKVREEGREAALEALRLFLADGFQRWQCSDE